jgi:hypothetical protein
LGRQAARACNTAVTTSPDDRAVHMTVKQPQINHFGPNLERLGPSKRC